MENKNNIQDIQDEQQQDDKDSSNRHANKLVRLIKSIELNPERGKSIDNRIIQYKYYNSFNYSLLSRNQDDVTLTLGVTSSKPRDGKTLVACNLAVSLALGFQKKTVLVDLNIHNPRLHQIFDVVQSPGLVEAFTDGQIHVSETAIEHLSILSSGNLVWHPENYKEAQAFSYFSTHFINNHSLGLDHLPAFRDVIYSLEQEFEIVIVDLPAVTTQEVPVLFMNQLQGLVVVIQSGKTKREDLDIMFQHINEHQVLGFVFNRAKEEQI